MFKQIFMTAGFAACISIASAQTETVSTKLLRHSVGVQANQLIKQIINLNSNSDIIDNPYLLTYSLNLAKSGWGINAGLGYDYTKIVDKDVPGNRETKLNHLFYRFGAGRKSMISKKIEVGYSLDYVGNYQLDKTFSFLVQDEVSFTDSSSTSVTSKTKSKGSGMQFTLAYHITDRFIVSTEATYYYLQSKQKQNVLVSETFHDVINDKTTTTTSNTNLETETSKFNFAVPVALFLVLKF
jgi:hypothetical protein